MPRRVRPRIPEAWHVPNDPRLWVTWAHANQRLKDERVYWVSTASPRGGPHAAPVWGIWNGRSFYFETDPKSVKGRNLAISPLVVVHAQDGNDTVIVQGTAERERDPTELESLRKAYVRKYSYRPNWSDETKQIVFRVAPKVVHAWKTPRMHRSQVKFVF